MAVRTTPDKSELLADHLSSVARSSDKKIEALGFEDKATVRKALTERGLRFEEGLNSSIVVTANLSKLADVVKLHDTSKVQR